VALWAWSAHITLLLQHVQIQQVCGCAAHSKEHPLYFVDFVSSTAAQQALLFASCSASLYRHLDQHAHSRHS
jgi:hypothetical protein